MAEYRIDELAHKAGTTVRNIRAYQDRGLLPPPRLEGRVGYYDDNHLARLRLIGQLLARGYTFAIIKELLVAWEHGKDVSEVLGLEKVLTDPWSDELPGQVTVEELVKTFGAGLDDEQVARFLDRAVALGLIEPEGDHYRVPSPRLLHVGAELVAAGIPLDAVLDIAEQIRADCDVIAGRFVNLVNEHVFDRMPAAAPGAEEIPQLAAIVRRMRPLVKMVVDPFIARAMEARAQEALGARLELIRDHLQQAGR
ncbi:MULTISPECIES: MerR family transcriptional regulator [Thermomonospora]|uniref:DNA-binding transcriptional MerR regulator n=1 Tax=Thermomonospora cellulosilytica TaxID=1411118 RepID=A0A7W3R7H1_9ACTN|nr:MULTISPECIES: MerR family transcriptional regulator [Thermomonospora]MBA9002340.1 DNA-binding transcriptional MerR regulator [Thermomonospora cellulosilytica]